MGPGDERRPGRIGVGDLGLAASVRCRFRRAAAGPLAIDGSRGLGGIGVPGLRERDSVGAYLVRAGLALLVWLVPWRAVPASGALHEALTVSISPVMMLLFA